MANEVTHEECVEAIAKACAQQFDVLDGRIRELKVALRHAVSVAREARQEWDSAPNGMKAGKLLIALAGDLPSYRADIDKIHAALDRMEDGK